MPAEIAATAAMALASVACLGAMSLAPCPSQKRRTRPTRPSCPQIGSWPAQVTCVPIPPMVRTRQRRRTTERGGSTSPPTAANHRAPGSEERTGPELEWDRVRVRLGIESDERANREHTSWLCEGRLALSAEFAFPSASGSHSPAVSERRSRGRRRALDQLPSWPAIGRHTRASCVSGRRARETGSCKTSARSLVFGDRMLSYSPPYGESVVNRVGYRRAVNG
jgi:hypothetical protein